MYFDYLDPLLDKKNILSDSLHFDIIVSENILRDKNVALFFNLS